MLTVWDLQTNEQRFEPVRIDHVSRSVTISDDGSRLVVAGSPLGRTQVSDGVSGALQLELDPLPVASAWGISGDTESVLFAPNGRLAVLSRSGVIRIFDVATGVELQRLDGTRGAVGETASFSQDGSVLVTAGVIGFRRLGCRGVRDAVPGARARCPVRDDRLRRVHRHGAVPDQHRPGDRLRRRERQRDRPVRRTTGWGLRLRGESRWNEVHQGGFMCQRRLSRTAPGVAPRRCRAGQPPRYRTSSPHYVEQYGFGGDSSALVAWIGTVETTRRSSSIRRAAR